VLQVSTVKDKFATIIYKPTLLCCIFQVMASLEQLEKYKTLSWQQNTFLVAKQFLACIMHHHGDTTRPKRHCLDGKWTLKL
jgi:hypothetical protein